MKLEKRILGIAVGLAFSLGAPLSQAETVLTVVSGGSQNMVDYVTDFLGPLFEKQNPGVKVKAIGVGPDDAGSQKIVEKLQAQKNSGQTEWDVDVVVPNQQKTGEMVKAGLLMKYRESIPTGKYAVSAASKMALGVNVDGYVMPMFQSQTALAYNPALVKTPAAAYDELRQWAAKNPKAFGYNGLKGGMSGVAFIVGWMYAYGGHPDTVQQGPYDVANEAGWDKALAELKQFNQLVTFTPGNAGTLDRRLWHGIGFTGRETRDPHPDSVRGIQPHDDAGNHRSTRDRHGAKAVAMRRDRRPQAAAGVGPCAIQLSQGHPTLGTTRPRHERGTPSRASESPGSLTTQQPAARAARC